MASDDDSDASVLSNKNNKTTEIVTSFKCCKNRQSKSLTCIQCGSVYHRGCAKKSLENRFTAIDDSRMVCCSNLDNKGEVSVAVLYQQKVEALLNEIDLWKKLFAQSEEKNSILKLNNGLLLESLKKSEVNYKNLQQVQIPSDQNKLSYSAAAQPAMSMSTNDDTSSGKQMSPPPVQYSVPTINFDDASLGKQIAPPPVQNMADTVKRRRKRHKKHTVASPADRRLKIPRDQDRDLSYAQAADSSHMRAVVPQDYPESLFDVTHLRKAMLRAIEDLEEGAAVPLFGGVSLKSGAIVRGRWTTSPGAGWKNWSLDRH
ncbi:unnamed protein product [Brassicogethes aeneus]|uniref:Uncharacterized protein n=1 Tax=Brassicogethes aeneus TaxID=1431903 RepID=A0A9P0FC49_BRAAE|nr:unnamed protein product [Brassicogethes aeneus]